MRLIAFSGKMGSGKSTAIEALREYTKRPVVLVKFAQPLYDMQEYIYSRVSSVYKRPEDFVKDRKLLQWLGTEWGRDSINKNLWVKIWESEVLATAPEAIVTCDDVRFDNEATRVIMNQGAVVKINSTHNIARITTANGISNHASEKEIAPELAVRTVDNDGTKEDFKRKLFALYSTLGIPVN